MSNMRTETPIGAMLSIRPKWCELIAEGRKTRELRKSRPTPARLRLPFTVYVYCTQPVGKVIGSFICTGFDTLSLSNKSTFYYDDSNNTLSYDLAPEILSPYCLTVQEMEVYLKGRIGYGWHISEFNLYSIPKELGAFDMKRPPQSWCYVSALS